MVVLAVPRWAGRSCSLAGLPHPPAVSGGSGGLRRPWPGSPPRWRPALRRDAGGLGAGRREEPQSPSQCPRSRESPRRRVPVNRASWSWVFSGQRLLSFLLSAETSGTSAHLHCPLSLPAPRRSRELRPGKWSVSPADFAAALQPTASGAWALSPVSLPPSAQTSLCEDAGSPPGSSGPWSHAHPPLLPWAF